ncbi:MAG: hypothetical protein MHM6MM_003180 [Cercozoa sp. M6MM]
MQCRRISRIALRAQARHASDTCFIQKLESLKLKWQHAKDDIDKRRIGMQYLQQRNEVLKTSLVHPNVWAHMARLALHLQDTNTFAEATHRLASNRNVFMQLNVDLLSSLVFDTRIMLVRAKQDWFVQQVERAAAQLWQALLTQRLFHPAGTERRHEVLAQTVVSLCRLERDLCRRRLVVDNARRFGTNQDEDREDTKEETEKEHNMDRQKDGVNLDHPGSAQEEGNRGSLDERSLRDLLARRLLLEAELHAARLVESSLPGMHLYVLQPLWAALSVMMTSVSKKVQTEIEEQSRTLEPLTRADWLQEHVSPRHAQLHGTVVAQLRRTLDAVADELAPPVIDAELLERLEAQCNKTEVAHEVPADIPERWHEPDHELKSKPKPEKQVENLSELRQRLDQQVPLHSGQSSVCRDRLQTTFFVCPSASRCSRGACRR